MTKAVKLLVASQVVLAVAMVWCTLRLPQFLFSWDQGGMGNYALHAQTIVQFSVGFIGCGVLVCLGARALPPGARHRKAFRAVLLLVGVLCVLVALTTYTYKMSHFFHELHNRTTQALFFVELPAALWFTFYLAKTTLAKWLCTLFLAGFALAVLTLAGYLHLLFIAEALTTFAFGALMAVTAQNLTRHASG